MRVYYDDHTYIDFPDVDHWESICGDWVELANADGEIKAILNWSKVWLMRPLSEKDSRIERF